MTPTEQNAILKAENVSLKSEIVTLLKAAADMKRRLAFLTEDRDYWRKRYFEVVK